MTRAPSSKARAPQKPGSLSFLRRDFSRLSRNISTKSRVKPLQSGRGKVSLERLPFGVLLHQKGGRAIEKKRLTRVSGEEQHLPSQQSFKFLNAGFFSDTTRLIAQWIITP